MKTIIKALDREATEKLAAKLRKEIMAGHKNDRCFSCKVRNFEHGGGFNKNGKLCTDFEFIAPSARNLKMIDFTAQFKSESSEAVYSVRSWKYGDYSCNCRGWTTKRTCWHTETVASNPDKYKKQTTQSVSGSQGSVEATVSALKDKMTEMEAAVKRGNPIELARLQAEVEYQQQMFEAAGAGLGERFAQVQANIRQHVYEESQVEVQAPQSTSKHVITSEGHEVVDADDPFAV